MERQQVSAEEIRGVIVDRIRHLGGDCQECGVPRPVPLDQPDAAGCNWKIDFVPACPHECVGMVERIVEEARSKYNLNH